MIRAFFAFILTMIFSSAHAEEPKPLNPVEIKEWEISYGGRSRDPFAESANSVWFVGQGGNYLARLNPETGDIFHKDLKDEPGPHNLIVGSDGMVWYSGNLEGYIGRYDPKSDTIEKIEMPEPDADDPHTLVFDADEQNIWFTVQWGNYVGRLELETRKVDLIPVPTSSSRPYGIIVAPDGTPWIVLLGTDKMASVDPKTLKLTEHNIAPGARPRRIGVTSDGRLYYTDYRRGYIGRLDPNTGQVDEWALPAGRNSNPYGMAVDNQDRIWVVETGPRRNTFVGFDPAQEKTISVTPIPSGAGSVRHMHYHKPSNMVWFGTDENTIGRAVID
ncbi:MAG: hypothetical protein OQK24_05830 [Magnetovibrio sp.]|nr:hypothetical protein [Magnetovibrio sp.]